MPFRSFLYRLASLLGDFNAIKHHRYAKRLVRKTMTKQASRLINRLLK